MKSFANKHTGIGIILAAGQGSRMNKEIPKQFLLLGGRPLFFWSLDIFESCSKIDHTLLVLPEEYHSTAHSQIVSRKYEKLIKIAKGGATRQESVYNALCSHTFMDEDIILIHDAARPFITVSMIENCLLAAEETGAAGLYVPVTDTIAEVRNGFVAEVPTRDILFNAQTPQGFRFSILKEAHDKARGAGLNSITDDVALVFKEGHSVKIVQGDQSNYKITNSTDWERAEIYARSISR